MQTEDFFIGAAESIGANALMWFFVGLVLLLTSIVLTVRLLQRYPLWHEPGRHSMPVLLTRFGIGYLLIVACGLVFAEMADEINIGEDLARFDLSLTQALLQNTPDTAFQAFAWITHLGDTATMTVIGIVVAVMLFIFRQRWLALGWVIAVVGNSLLNITLKAVFERVRPLDDHGLALIGGWSFPSGHSSGSVVVYGMLGYVLIRITPKAWHLPVVLLAATVAFSTGCSRIFLQYHYASDVLAGFVSGSAWLAVCISTLELTRWHHVWRRPLTIKR